MSFLQFSSPPASICIRTVCLHAVASYARPGRVREVSDGGSALLASPKLHGPVVVLRDDGSPAATWQRMKIRLIREGISSIYCLKGAPLNAEFFQLLVAPKTMAFRICHLYLYFFSFKLNNHLMTKKERYATKKKQPGRKLCFIVQHLNP